MIQKLAIVPIIKKKTHGIPSLEKQNLWRNKHDSQVVRAREGNWNEQEEEKGYLGVE